MSDIVHLQPVVYEMHLYSQDGSNFADRDRPIGAAQVRITGDTAHVSCLNCHPGTFRRAHYREMLRQLREIGVTRMTEERHGAIKKTEVG